MDAVIAVITCSLLAATGFALVWWPGVGTAGVERRWASALRFWLNETGLAGQTLGAVAVGAVGIVALVATTVSALIPLPVVVPIAVCGSMGVVCRGARGAQGFAPAVGTASVAGRDRVAAQRTAFRFDCRRIVH